MSKNVKLKKKSTAIVEQEVDTRDERLEFLLPGHIWRRVDTGQLSTVLFVTNAYLTPEQQQKFPPQVVYVDAAGRRTSAGVERFLKGRVFESVNPDIEKRVEELLEPIPEPEAESVSSETVRPEHRDEDPAPEQAPAAPARSQVDISFESSSNQQMPDLPQQALKDAFLQYEQDPDLINGFIRHKLLFSLADLSLDQVRDAFGSPGAVYGTFRIKNDQANLNIEWDEFQGAFPIIDADGTYASLVFLTPATTKIVGTAPTAPAEAAPAPAGDSPVTFEGQAAAPAAPVVTASPVVTAAPAVQVAPAA